MPRRIDVIRGTDEEDQQEMRADKDTEETYVVSSRMRGRRFPGVRRNVLEAAASDARGIILRAT